MHPGTFLPRPRLCILLRLPGPDTADPRTMKPRTPTAPNRPDPPLVFCTECGVDLENFCFSETAKDVAAIRRTLAQCKKEGRFVGEACAKLFVATGSDPDAMRRELADERYLDRTPPAFP